MESHWTIEFAPIYEISLNPEPKICLNMHWVPGLGARIFHTKVLGKGKMLLRHFQRGHNKLRQGATSFQPRFKQVLVLLVTVHFLGPFSHKHWPAPKTVTRTQPPCTLYKLIVLGPCNPSTCQLLNTISWLVKIQFGRWQVDGVEWISYKILQVAIWLITKLTL